MRRDPAIQLVAVRGEVDPVLWRRQARALLHQRGAGVHPDDVEWLDPDEPQSTLFQPETTEPVPPQEEGATLSVPRGFLDLTRLVLAHTDPLRFAVLYRVLWRLTRGKQPRLLSDAADPDVRALNLWAKAVRRDAHKMKAFVRFRRVDEHPPSQGNNGRFVAFHRPDYNILELVGTFFARRFGVMCWSILTPRGSIHWDGRTLDYGPAVTAREGPAGDGLEDLWRTYYASVFNPARVNERAMLREMPKRHWATLPEASLIDQLLREANTRTRGMVQAAPTSGRSAAAYLPQEPRASLPVLRNAAAACRGCEIFRSATRTVFGEGPPTARLMLVGEQPGNDEDLAGRPFVGPAGRVLDEALAQAGIERRTLYVTNAVKHFKWRLGGPAGRRSHQRASVQEVTACRPWLEQEIGLVRPACIVLLGATAAQSLLGPAFRVTRSRGQVITGTRWADALVPTWHPSAILRTPEPAGAGEMLSQLVADLRLSKQQAMSMKA